MNKDLEVGKVYVFMVNSGQFFDMVAEYIGERDNRYFLKNPCILQSVPINPQRPQERSLQITPMNAANPVLKGDIVRFNKEIVMMANNANDDFVKKYKEIVMQVTSGIIPARSMPPAGTEQAFIGLDRALQKRS